MITLNQNLRVYIRKRKEECHKYESHCFNKFWTESDMSYHMSEKLITKYYIFLVLGTLWIYGKTNNVWLKNKTKTLGYITLMFKKPMAGVGQVAPLNVFTLTGMILHGWFPPASLKAYDRLNSLIFSLGFLSVGRNMASSC